MGNEISLPGFRYGRDLSYDQRKELEDKASTENILNLAAQEGGVLRRSEHIDVHGEDATRREVHQGNKGPEDPFHTTVEIGAGGAHAGYDLAETFAEEHLAHIIGAVGMDAAGGLGAMLAMKDTAEALPRAWEAGDREAEARVQDAMHLATLGALRGLPVGFRTEQVERRSEAVGGSNSEAARITSVVDGHPELRAILQLRCDEGMKSAEQAIVGGEGAARFFQTDKALYARYVSDPAFKLGFDAVIWAKGKDAATFTQTVEQLHQRDARWSSTNCVWHG
jgi:hypothetical protein